MNDENLGYYLYYNDLTINRDYNSLNDPEYKLINQVSRQTDSISYYPCKNDSNGFKKPYQREHFY